MLFFSTLLAFHYIITAVEPIRQQPKPNAEVVSEAICAEEVSVIDVYEDWAKIEMACDRQQGWVKHAALYEREMPYADCSCIVPIVEVRTFNTAVYEKKDKTQEPIMQLPWECRLEAEDPYTESSWVKIRLPDRSEVYIQREDVNCDIRGLTKDETAAFSRRFLKLPFRVGGRSSFGFDNAGFIQMLYRQMGQLLPRKVEAQYRFGEFVPISLEALEPGDLIFWGKSESEIAHVGMFIGVNQFIHASMEEDKPSVKISALDDPLYRGVGKWTFRAGRKLSP